jgi:hypothetical protein
MPTLADIYSAINTAKRKGADFISNPGTSLQQMIGNANDRARVYNQELNLAAQGFGAPARGQQPTPEQLAAQQSVMDTFAEAYNPAGMVVYHGSPHVFERFSMGKIGLGAGQQAYGKGLYMTEAPAVAQGYAQQSAVKAFSKSDEFAQLPEAIKPDVLRAFQKETAKDRQLAVNQLTKKYPELANIDPMNYSNFYKVDLPDTHVRRMLDFDTPLKNQPKPIRNLAKLLGMDLNDLGGDLVGKIGKGEEGRQILQNAGIPGVKYLDEANKGANTGTRNFVVFDDKHLKILERNDKPIK